MVSLIFFIIIKYKITTKILNGFRRKEKTAAIFFDIEKAYDKVNGKKAINVILGELRNGVDGSLFADDLAI